MGIKRFAVAFMASVFLASSVAPVTALAYSKSDVEAIYNKLGNKGSYSDGAYTVNGKTISGVYSSDAEAQAAGLSSTVHVTLGGHTYSVSQGSLDSLYSALSSQVSSESAAASDKSAKGVEDKINKLSTNLNLQADTDSASVALGGFKPLIQTITGILVVVTMLLTSLITGVDILYVTTPFARSFLDSHFEGGGGMSRSTDGGGNTFRFISDEALAAVKAQDTGEAKGSAIGKYTTKRIPSLIMLGICLYIFITGQVGLLISIGVRLVSGFINLVGGAFGGGGSAASSGLIMLLGL